MILFLYGKDEYRMKEKMKEIVESYKKSNKNCLGLVFFDCQKDNFKNFEDSSKQTSMFKEKKLFVLINPFSDSSFRESFLEKKEYFLNSEDIFIFLQEGEVLKSNLLFKFLEKNSKTQKFDFLTGQKLKNWIIKRVNSQKSKIEAEAISLLLNYIGSDLWRMGNEVDKLSNFKKDQTIKKEDVSFLVRANIETDIFKTIDSIAQKKKDVALSLLKKHINKGDSPLYLISMINYQFRNLLIVKDFIEKRLPYGAIAKKSGLHPFVVKKTFYLCQKFSFEEIKKIYKNILKTDMEIKVGKISPEAGLEMLVIEI